MSRGLIKALRYQKDTGISGVAAEALGRIGDARAVEPLIAALKDSNKNVRKSATRQVVDRRCRAVRAAHRLHSRISDMFVHWGTAEAAGQNRRSGHRVAHR